MKLTKYAQSTIMAEVGGVTVLIDPGNYNFEPGRVQRSFFDKVDILIVTHKHDDHFDLDAVKAIYTSCAPLILTVAEIADTLTNAAIPAQVLSVGHMVEHAGFRVEAVYADHVVRGEAVDIFGVVLESNNKRVYHASDTFYFEEKPKDIDVVFVPINNRGVAMDFADAKRFVQDIQPRIAVPVHYDSPKDAHIHPEDWAALLAETGILVPVLGFGDSIEVQ